MGKSETHFSVIIPTYNRPQPLTACLAALAALDFPREEYEVIVVDDGGATPLDAVVAPFAEGMRLRLLRQANAGPAAARNRGAGIAMGRYLVFTDDDCAPESGWLRAFATQFGRTPEHLLGGATVNRLVENPFAAASQELIDILYRHFNQQEGSATFFASNNMAMPRDLFHAVGGFSTAFPLSAGEDRDFCDHWLHRGYRLTYTPAARLHHAHHLTLRSYWRQHFNYGRGAVTFHGMRANRGAGGLKIDRDFHLNPQYWIIQPVRHTHAWYRLLMPPLLFLSQVANLAGYLYERNRAMPNPANSQADAQPR